MCKNLEKQEDDNKQPEIINEFKLPICTKVLPKFVSLEEWESSQQKKKKI